MLDVICAVVILAAACSIGHSIGYYQGFKVAMARCMRELNESTAQVLAMRHLGGEQQRKDLPS